MGILVMSDKLYYIAEFFWIYLSYLLEVVS
jgi:hypothetical protein